MTITSSRSATGLAASPVGALTGALLFLSCYLAVSPVRGAATSTAAPLPGDPAAELRAYAVDNPLALTLTACLQLASVVGLLIFMVTSTSPSDRRARLAGGMAVAAMTVSSSLSLIVAAGAAGFSPGTVGALNTGSFLTGGVVHVFCLGLLVGLARKAYPSRALRVLGLVAAAVSILSLLSLAVYFANVFILIGRLLCMLWTVLAGISLVRRRASLVANPRPTPPVDHR